MNKIVIGLAASKTAGKSTVAKIIKNLIPGTPEYGQADKLKDVCSDVFGIGRSYFDLQTYKEVPFHKPRIVTQKRIEEILEAYGLDNDYARGLFIQFGTQLMRSPRHTAQWVGTELLRSLGNPNIHSESVPLNDPITIISDIRFQDEFEYFSNLEGVDFHCMYIARDSAEALITEHSHQSEKEVLQFKDRCHIIDNNGSLDDLENLVEGFIDDILD